MPKRQIAKLYLELAAECFDRSAKAGEAGTADAMRRMGDVYLAAAVASDPSANTKLEEGFIGQSENPKN
jgi:hypothetical protein